MEGWQTIIALGALALAAITLLARSLDKNLSIREYEEFKATVNRDRTELKNDMHRAVDELKRAVEMLGQSRPTTRELEITADYFKEQLAKLERKLGDK